MISSSDLSPGGLTGRAAETAAIRRAVGRSRLVTVTGLPGVGKTATALVAAATAGSRLPDGGWLIRLGTLADEALLPHTIAAALRLPDSFAAGPLQALTSGLRSKRLLILLDTCEHLLGACAAIATALRQACPGVRILATSREPLRVPGEQTMTIGPLPIRDAVNLFGQRASSWPSDSASDPSNKDLDKDKVRAVCEKLDGLPLAIELAARQLGSGSLDALLAGLDSGYDFLSNPDAPVPRHRTLQAAIGWSHELCTPAERLLWARLAVFDGPFCRKDGQDVCATTYLTDETISVGIMMLAERSILLREPQEPPRFVMPATIRAYGLAMLGRLAEDEEMARRYRRWRSGPRCDATCH